MGSCHHSVLDDGWIERNDSAVHEPHHCISEFHVYMCIVQRSDKAFMYQSVLKLAQLKTPFRFVVCFCSKSCLQQETQLYFPFIICVFLLHHFKGACLHGQTCIFMSDFYCVCTLSVNLCLFEELVCLYLKKII